MEFKQAVGGRRTIRYFKSWQPVEAAKIQTILEAGRLQSQHGNAKLIRKAVVIERGKTNDTVRDALIDAMYNQPHVQQAPVFIVWAIDMSGWDSLRDTLKELIDVRALNSTHGWSKEFIETAVIPNPDFNVMAGDNTFAEWLSAFECGLAVGSALLAAVDEGLGTALVTGRIYLDCRNRYSSDLRFEEARCSPLSGDASMTQHEFAACATVQKYVAELADKGLTEAEQQERLTILAEFCNFVGRTPDQMVAEIFDVEMQKYRKRNFYSDRVKEFSAQIPGTWSARTARGNVIRSFFIANGRRLPNEKPDWL